MEKNLLYYRFYGLTTKAICCLLLSFLLLNPAFAKSNIPEITTPLQLITIKGKVNDEKGIPMPGVTVTNATQKKSVSSNEANFKRVDLASTTEWQLQIDGKGKWQSVNVPYGGWNSDMQTNILDENKDVQDFVIYRRNLEIGKDTEGQVIKIHFGAVNFGAEVYIDGNFVTQHHSNFTAFDADITQFVSSGKKHKLEVKAYVLNHYKDNEGRYTMPTGFIYGNKLHDTGITYDNKLSKYPFGIARKIEMRIYPLVYISDVFVKPSVSQAELKYEVSITNSSDQDRILRLSSKLGSWNGDNFLYPTIPEKEIEVKAKSTEIVSLNNIPWLLGKESYWWPNVPFKEDYVAKLHNLNLKISETTKEWNNYIQRFGFVEHAEGPYYYTINGVRVNLPADASAATQGSIYDAYAESEAYKYYPEINKGCKETWRKFMRLGIRAVRTHQEPPTQNILDAADETGFVIIPETAIRGSYYKYPQSSDPANPYYRQHIQDMVRECRNHPSVARYSLSNELHAVPEYIDMGWPLDNTRPYVFETNTFDKSARIVSKLGHAYVVNHYVDYPKPAQAIYGLGEYAWSTDGINEFVTQGKLMRINDISYFAGWSWTNYWPNFLEGWSHDTYAWQQNNHPNRIDGVDGWGSPLIEYVKKSLSPFLIVDKEIELKNRFTEDWPAIVPYLMPNGESVRELYVFNDDLSGDAIDFTWETRWDSPTGELVQSRSKTLTIKPGFYAIENLKLQIPKLDEGRKERKLFLVLVSSKNKKVLFSEKSLWYNISSEKPSNEIELIGEDLITKGNWKGKYGEEGYDIAGVEQKLPGYIKLEYYPSSIHKWKDNTDDERALQRFINNGNTGVTRVAAAHTRYGNIAMTVDVGSQNKQMAIYFMDWDRDYPLPVAIMNNDKKIVVENFKQGKYLIFKVKGKVTLMIGDGRNSNVSGVFFDKLN